MEDGDAIHVFGLDLLTKFSLMRNGIVNGWPPRVEVRIAVLVDETYPIGLAKVGLTNVVLGCGCVGVVGHATSVDLIRTLDNVSAQIYPKYLSTTGDKPVDNTGLLTGPSADPQTPHTSRSSPSCTEQPSSGTSSPKRTTAPRSRRAPQE